MQQKNGYYQINGFESGGEIGIRTLGTLTGTPHFECGAFDHSAISPLFSMVMVMSDKRLTIAKERGH
jgi:hypothetical protein